ncbi:hypothetical protein HYDPIDRAFT_111203 [Hydnomerulius pinastri MD-312]|uniref:Uncharacterized protein n=1 Tax=Hydnomerulius pinastri MD-312 TaxID=994086 RepID=A0A0C9WFZ4_9AGAM|nr:hypothetical protein HYDPIDRAFT_111203 [Hydnomerulius pinastri MD-312]
MDLPMWISFSEIHINNVSWPSLYNPIIELSKAGFNSPVQPGGSYLQKPNEIFQFTLYWTLIFHIPFYILAGTYAFFNFLFPPARPTNNSFLLFSPLPSRLSPSAPLDEWTKPPRINARRSRLTFALLVLLAFLSFGLISAVMGAAVVGFVLAGVYKAGGFYMSTWVPFTWAVIQGLIALLGIWPSIIDII